MYRRGHIPGAVAWSWYTDLTCPNQGACIDQSALARLLARAGIDAATTMVLYGGGDNRFAAAAFWLVRYLGFPRVALLNGAGTSGNDRANHSPAICRLMNEPPSPCLGYAKNTSAPRTTGYLAAMIEFASLTYARIRRIGAFTSTHAWWRSVGIPGGAGGVSLGPSTSPGTRRCARMVHGIL